MSLEVEPAPASPDGEVREGRGRRRRPRRTRLLAPTAVGVVVLALLGVVGAGSLAVAHVVGGPDRWSGAPLPDTLDGLARRDGDAASRAVDAYLAERAPRWPDTSWAVGLYGDPAATPEGHGVAAPDPHAATVVWYRGDGAEAVYETDKEHLALAAGMRCGRVDPNRTSCAVLDDDEGVGLLVSARTAPSVEDTVALTTALWEQR